MNDELLPCPFCGERPVLLRDGTTAAHACTTLDIELRVPRLAWNHRYRETCSVPVYSDGEPIMPGDIVRHPDMHDPRMVTEVVLGLHGAFVRCMCGFETMRHDLFRRADADTPASLADEIDNGLIPGFRAIVRCRDCKYMDTVDLSWIYGDHRNDHCFCERLDDGFGVEPDGFCAWGDERRGS